LLPLLMAGLDGLARARRRKLRVGRWTLWTLSLALPFLCSAVFCWLLGKLGIIGAAPSVPAPAGSIPLGGQAVTALLAVVLTFALSWLLWASVLRRAGLPRRPEGDAAGLAVVLVLTLLGAIVWLGNPYTALLLIAAIHLWLLLASPELRPPRPAALALVVLGAAPLALLIAFYARQLGLGPFELPWGAVQLLAGGHVGLGSALLWSVALGCLIGAARVAAQGPVEPLDARPEDGVEITIRGPMSYAGPGSLGGTESALRR
jgi:hypothetical protein